MLIALLVLILALPLTVNVLNPHAKEASPRGDIAISVVNKAYSPVKKAVIYLDNEKIGETDNEGLHYLRDVESGEHEITIKKSEYTSKNKKVKVRQGSISQLQVVLKKKVNKKPLASIKAPSEVELYQSFQLSAKESQDPDGQITKYKWSFSKSRDFEKTGKQVQYKYETTGQKEITLKVTDNRGKSDQANFQIMVTYEVHYPEDHHPEKPVECFGVKAAALLSLPRIDPPPHLDGLPVNFIIQVIKEAKLWGKSSWLYY